MTRESCWVCFFLGSAVYKVASILQQKEIAHNLFMTRGDELSPDGPITEQTVRVILWPRHSSLGKNSLQSSLVLYIEQNCSNLWVGKLFTSPHFIFFLCWHFEHLRNFTKSLTYSVSKLSALPLSLKTLPGLQCTKYQIKYQWLVHPNIKSENM